MHFSPSMKSDWLLQLMSFCSSIRDSSRLLREILASFSFCFKEFRVVSICAASASKLSDRRIKHRINQQGSCTAAGTSSPLLEEICTWTVYHAVMPSDKCHFLNHGKLRNSESTNKETFKIHLEISTKTSAELPSLRMVKVTM